MEVNRARIRFFGELYSTFSIANGEIVHIYRTKLQTKRNEARRHLNRRGKSSEEDEKEEENVGIIYLSLPVYTYLAIIISIISMLHQL